MSFEWYIFHQRTQSIYDYLESAYSFWDCFKLKIWPVLISKWHAIFFKREKWMSSYLIPCHQLSCYLLSKCMWKFVNFFSRKKINRFIGLTQREKIKPNQTVSTFKIINDIWNHSNASDFTDGYFLQRILGQLLFSHLVRTHFLRDLSNHLTS